MSKSFSGKEVINILMRTYGFAFVSQKGSHVKLRKETPDRTLTTVVPLHRELARGTLQSALRLANISYEDFLEKK